MNNMRNFSNIESGSNDREDSSTPRVLEGKRVAMVLFSLYPSDPRARRAAEALLKEGVALDLICEGDDSSPRKEQSGVMNISRIAIKRRRGGFFSYCYQYSIFILIVTAIMAWRSLRKRYDLVYVHNMPDILVVCALIPKWLGAKVILDMHDPMPELMKTIFGRSDSSLAVGMLKAFERWSLRRADLVITVNKACKRIFGTRSCAMEKIDVVMNAPDAEIFPERTSRSYPMRNTAMPFVVMYHGSLVERNGAGLAVEAVGLLRSKIPNLEVRIYGRETAYLVQVMNRVREMGLEKVVRPMGHRTLEQLTCDIQACDVGIVPNYLNEFTRINTPTRLFEYLSQGKPVVAPLTQGVIDYFDSESLFYFNAGDASGLADRICEVFSDPERAIHVVERGQEIYRGHSWQAERKKMVDLIGNLMTNGSSSVLNTSPVSVNQA